MVESGGKTVINEPDAARVEPASQGCWAAMIINGDVAEMIDFAIENDAVEYQPPDGARNLDNAGIRQEFLQVGAQCFGGGRCRCSQVDQEYAGPGYRSVRVFGLARISHYGWPLALRVYASRLSASLLR